MTARVADYLPQKINQFVPGMTYSADVIMEGPVRVQLGVPVAADPNGIVAAQSMTTAGSLTSFAAAFSRTVMGRYGRCVNIDASGTGVKVVTITGRDYLGQPMVEDITLNSTTLVDGVKAFAWIEKVAWLDQSGINLDVGWGDIMGLPYKTQGLVADLIDAAGAGFVTVGTASTLVAGVETDPAIATTGDPRGTVIANDIPDGTSEYQVLVTVDRTNLHGVAHFFA